MTTNFYGMSSTTRSAMLFTPLYFLDYIPPICRVFFLAEAVRDGIVDLFDTVMYLLDHHTLTLHRFLTSHSYLSLTLTHSDDEDDHTTTSQRSSFPLFPYFPAEIRQLIWSFALEPPSGRLFHIEALRRADFGRTEAQWTFYQRRGRPGGMTLPMCPTQRIPYIAASCKEAYEVVQRHYFSEQRTHAKSQQQDGLSASATTSGVQVRGASMEGFRPCSDILYIDGLCLGCVPSAQVARNRIRTLASPRQGREVETVALEAGSLWSAAIGTNDVSVKPAVRREVLRAICEEFVGVKKLVLLGSRQCEKKGRIGVWSRLWAGVRKKGNGRNMKEGACEDQKSELGEKGSSVTRTRFVGAEQGKSSSDYGAFTGGAGMHLAFHPAVHGLASLLGWALGGDRLASRRRTAKTTFTEGRTRRNRRFIQQTAAEKECCKSLPVRLLGTEDFEDHPDHLLSDHGVHDNIDSGCGVDEIEAVQAVLAQLLEDEDIAKMPLIERKVIVRSAGCTGPWSYRTGMARESCSNDDWYWARRRLEQPVWRLADGNSRIEFS